MSQEKAVTCLTQDFVGPCNKQANTEEAIMHPMGIVGATTMEGRVNLCFAPGGQELVSFQSLSQSSLTNIHFYFCGVEKGGEDC